MKKFSFLPMFPDEVKARGWDTLDVIIVSGDPYVDHPSFGTAVVGRLLEGQGLRVGIIAQPDWRSADDFARLGRPKLAVCVTAGNVDSMVANHTANKKPRREFRGHTLNSNNELSVCPRNSDLRPDRASIVYANRCREVFKGLPLILGGVEASMRRLAHYDYWDDAVRRSLLMDSKADMIIYGMAERPLAEVFGRLSRGEAIASIRDVRGTVVKVKPVEVPPDAVRLPSFEEVQKDPAVFNTAFRLAYEQMSPADARPLAQPHADQAVLQLPPALPLAPQELDKTYELPYTRRAHPAYERAGGVKALETVRWSITAVRGCPGECAFCGIAMHQGRIVQSRTPGSVLQEAQGFTQDKEFRGTINDVGGPTANLYGAACANWDKGKACHGKQCLMPEKCPSLKLGSEKARALYESLRRIPGVKHVFVQSGLRYDLLLQPEAREYFKSLVEHHVSGQMKVAPEHTVGSVLQLMNKPPYECYERFVREFERVNSRLKDRRYLVNYFISAHPGAGLKEAEACARELRSHGMRPEQIQDFLPLPMTVAGCMYHTGRHPLTGEAVYVPRTDSERRRQRELLQAPDARGRRSAVKEWD